MELNHALVINTRTRTDSLVLLNLHVVGPWGKIHLFTSLRMCAKFFPFCTLCSIRPMAKLSRGEGLWSKKMCYPSTSQSSYYVSHWLGTQHRGEFTLDPSINTARQTTSVYAVTRKLNEHRISHPCTGNIINAHRPPPFPATRSLP